MIINWILVTFFFVHFKWWINHFVSSNVIEIGVWAMSSYLQKLAFLPPQDAVHRRNLCLLMVFRNKWRPSKWKQAKSTYSDVAVRESRPSSLVVGRDWRQAEEWERDISGVPWWRLLVWETWGQLTRSGHPVQLVRGAYLAFSGWPWVGIGNKS